VRRSAPKASAITIRSASRALDILEFLSRRSFPASVGIIGSTCGIPKSSLHQLLRLLESRRFVKHQTRERTWSAGPRIAELSAGAPLFVHALAVLKAFESAQVNLDARSVSVFADLPLASVSRILDLMSDYGLIRTQADGTYGLGLEFVSLASRVGRVDRLRTIAQPYLVRLRDASGETANLMVRDGESALYIDQVESHHGLRYSGWVGHRISLHGTAAGAAFADPSKSHAVSDAVEVGVTAIACQIPDSDPPLAINILAPTPRLKQTGVDRSAQMVEAIAHEIAVRLAQDWSAGTTRQ
jgi:IclR family acetate operon transcriptional repressor